MDFEFIFDKALFNGRIVNQNDFIDTYRYDERNVYEVVRIINSDILFWEQHLERLNNSILNVYGKKLNLDTLIFDIKTLIKENDISNGNIKIEIIFQGEDFDIYIYPISFYYPDENLGVDVITYSVERKNPTVKSYDYEFKNNMGRLIKDNGVYELLLVNRDGFITEGSRTNVYFLKGKDFYTAPSHMVLNGVTRLNVNRIIKELGFVLFEKSVQDKEIDKFDACFLTSTSSNVLPVNRINSLIMDSSCNKYVREVINSFKRYIK